MSAQANTSTKSHLRASVKRYLTPPDYAEKLGVHSDRVRQLIKEGLLQAFDLNAGTGKRPRYRISAEAIAAYEQSITVAPPLKPKRRVRPAGIKQFV